MSGTARARALTITPLSLLKTHDLLFGNLVPSAIAGTVTINADTDAPIYAGVSGAGGTVQAARLLGAGSAGQMINVKWTNGAFTLTRVGGGATMQVDSLDASSALLTRGNSGVGVIPPDRAFAFRFGARLLVGANQLEGTYEGTFNVTVDYM